METKVYNVKELHFEHRIWKGEMKIILGELNIYQEWLSCMSVKSTDVEFQKNIDYFQNKFDIQRTHFDSFNDRINAQEAFIESLGREDNELDSKTITDNTNLRDDINTALKIYKDLKEDYKKFCSGVKF